ncbi:MAG: hypothetical protein CL678_00855 [Bdellovibrionaceae bacterium]|nr:hypothetical protein [Pseudobdellovibrionaceae bacterium]
MSDAKSLVAKAILGIFYAFLYCDTAALFKSTKAFAHKGAAAAHKGTAAGATLQPRNGGAPPGGALLRRPRGPILPALDSQWRRHHARCAEQRQPQAGQARP